MDTPTLPMFLAFEIAFLAAGHWIPHAKSFLGALNSPFRLIFNYTYGVIAIIAPFIWWLRHERPTDPIDTANVLLAMSVIGGITVSAAYGIDWLAEWLKRVFEERKMNDIKRTKDAESQRK